MSSYFRNTRVLPYDLKYLIRCLLGLLLVIAVMKVVGGSGFIVMFGVLFTCVSRKNNEVLLFALLSTIAITMGNGNIVSKGGIFSIAQRVMMLTLSGIMFIRIAGGRRSRILVPFVGMVFYLIYMIVPSVNGWCPIISLLKLFLYFMVYFAYYGVANSVINSSASTTKIRSVFLMLAVFFIFGSVALIPFPGISQMSWEVVQQMIARGQSVTSLFTGMTFHSQSLGPICAALGVVLFADLIFSIKKPDRLYLALLFCVPLLIWKTSSRTAMGSFVAGLAFTTFFFLRYRNVRSSWRSKVISSILSIVVVASIVVLVIPSTRESVAKFILKFNPDDQREVTFEDVTSTRRGKWDESLYYFRKSPFIGNGFQVSEEMANISVGLSTMSAPVEKGVWITAILEEGGVAGLTVFLLFTLIVFFSLNKYKCYQTMSSFFVLIMTNLGEFTMFSMTSTGGFLWSLVFVSVVLDAQRLKNENSMQRFGYAY